MNDRTCEVHVDITTTITNPVTGFSAMVCTQQTMTTPANRAPFSYARDIVEYVGEAHRGQLQSAEAHPS